MLNSLFQSDECFLVETAQHGYGGPQYYNHHHHNQPPAAPMGVGMGGPGGPGGPGSGGSRGGVIDFPLRILVQSDMVGAIIGRGGQVREAFSVRQFPE